MKDGFVGFIRAPGGELPGDGVLRHRGHTGRHPEPGGLRQVGQLCQGILIGPVAVDADQHRPGAAALHLCQTPGGGHRHPAAVGGARR